MTTIPRELSWSVATAFVNLLNEAIELDREAVSRLVNELVPCNQALADHPSIIVWSANEVRPPWSMRASLGQEYAGFGVGIVGLLNGLLPEGYRIAYEWDSGTGRILRFTVYAVPADEAAKAVEDAG